MWLYTPQNKKRMRLTFTVVGIIMIISFLALYIPSLQGTPPQNIPTDMPFTP